MYAPRGSTVNEAPAESNNGNDDVIIIRRGRNSGSNNEAATKSGAEEEEVASASRERGGESLGAKILKAPGRAVMRFLNNIRRHPFRSAGNFLTLTGALAIGHHLGLTKQLTSMLPEGSLRTVADKPGQWSHQMWGFGLERASSLTPEWLNSPARTFINSLGATERNPNGILGPR